MSVRCVLLTSSLVLLRPLAVAGQSVVVDEGVFAVQLAGMPAGTERFTIRRAGIGEEATVIAQAVIHLDQGSGTTELRPLLRALLPDGDVSDYQLKVSGVEIAELSLWMDGRRYAARIRTSVGEEEREFLARPGTHLLEEGVAHHYYFLRDVREGSRTPILEPRSRRQFQLLASPATEVELRVGAVRVMARRVTFGEGNDERSVWFDAQGRVLRVEIPALGYLAQRQDLVG
ncbi:MAG TPA: hypothetical protein VLA36_16900 [Longimicrobiales bacterium]|nr:hypothetical protein [Longimicrobiales bacterium]